MDEQSKRGTPPLTAATKDSVYMCPQCQSPYLEKSALVGGTARCLACAWSGQADELIEHEIQHQFTNRDEIIGLFVRELSGVVAKHAAKPLLETLVKWGFMESPPTTEQFTRYMKCIIGASAKAILEERKVMETEKIAKNKKAVS